MVRSRSSRIRRFVSAIAWLGPEAILPASSTVRDISSAAGCTAPTIPIPERARRVEQPAGERELGRDETGRAARAAA